MAIINFQCKKCLEEFDCETERITFGDILDFEKEIICPKCGKLNKDELWLTELGQTQIGELYFSEEDKNKQSIFDLCSEEGTGFNSINENNENLFYSLLFTIEETIYLYSQKDSSLEDSKIIESLKKLRDNIFTENYKFNTFEEEIINKIKKVLDINYYSKKDVSLSISKVLNSVKLHKFTDGKKGYLDFITEFFNKSEAGYF